MAWPRVLLVAGAVTGLVAARAASAQAAVSACPACPLVLAPVATRHLPRGTVLSESDLQVARVAVRGPQSDLPAAVAGWVTRRAIRAGEVLRSPAIARRPLVPRGSTVTVEVRVGTLVIGTTGVTVADAGLDDTVSVRLGPKRTVQGRVRGPGQVVLIDSARIE